jgi:soluble lytic murein transglycosylase-like protein
LEDLADHGFVDMYDTADNVGGGCYILRKLFDTYGDDEVHKVLMAYNMGGGRAAELWAQGITSSEYSRDIVKREKELSRYIDEQNGLN